MRFDDHITSAWNRPKPLEPGVSEVRLQELVVMLMKACASGIGILAMGQKLLREVRAMLREAAQAERDKRKLHMLRVPEWRLRVIKDLGGVEKLIRLWQRLSAFKANPQDGVKRPRPDLSEAEKRRRAHIQLCAKACAHPNIRRDPFKVDQEGQFRLPPMPRMGIPSRGIQREAAQLNTRVATRDYVYDARPVNDFTGFKAPIMVWPEEFFIFMNFEESARGVATESADETESVKAMKEKVAYHFAAYLNEDEDTPVVESVKDGEDITPSRKQPSHAPPQICEG